MTNREKDINKINMFITDIQNVIAKLKGWKRYAVKMNKTATNNEAQRQANFEFQKNIYLKNLINEKINQGIEDYINSTEINAITLITREKKSPIAPTKELSMWQIQWTQTTRQLTFMFQKIVHQISYHHTLIII